MILEVCIASLEGAYICDELGVTRVEVNKALSLGGITPATSLIKEIKSKTNLKVVSMLRPRAGNFIYDDYEYKELLLELNDLIAAGTDGVAFGINLPTKKVDLQRTKEIIDICKAKNVETVYHMAIDECDKPCEEMAKLVDLGITRILTRAKKANVIEGKDNFKRYIELFKDQVELLPGAGINSRNVLDFINYTKTKQIHGTFKKVVNGVIKTDQAEVAKVLKIMGDIN